MARAGGKLNALLQMINGLLWGMGSGTHAQSG